MLRRVPPAVLALAVTLVVIVGGVVWFVVQGGGGGRSLPGCTAALEAGPYGCVVQVSLDGTAGGSAADAPSGGAINYRVERTGGADRLVWTSPCGTGAAAVAVTPTAYRLGVTTRSRQGCSADERAVDAWAAALFTGAVRVDDRDDGTVVLAHGDRTARFAQVRAAGG